MDSQLSKPHIIIENMFENLNIERELPQSTSYELIPVNNSHDELLACLSLNPVAIIGDSFPISAQLVSQMPSSVKVITELGAGYDNIDVKACRQRNIELCHVPDYGPDTVAEHAVALVFAAQRRLLNFHKSIVDTHKWSYRAAGKLRNLNAMTLGIIGCGRTGTCFADKMRPLVKKILTYNPKNSITNTMAEIFEQCDIISLHIPYTKANHHLISSDSITQMKCHPILINVSRGGLIDTEALIQGLKSGQISYAALDVIENEPMINEELIQLDNVLLTPHVAWYSVESERTLREKAIGDTLRVLRGEKPINPIPE